MSDIEKLIEALTKTAKDPVEALFLAIIGYSFVQVFKETNIRIPEWTTPVIQVGSDEDHIKWALEEVKNCEDDKCLEAVVKELSKRIKKKKSK